MQKILDQQLERLLSEETQPRLSVIIRMESPSDEKHELLRIASDSIQQRNMSLSARDLLPVPRKEILLARSGRRAAEARKRLQAADSSVAAQVAASAKIPAVTRSVLRTAGRKNLQPLLSAAVVRKALKEIRPRGKRGVDVPQFWTSKSLLLEMSRDDLAKLPSAVSQIQGIYPNRASRG